MHIMYVNVNGVLHIISMYVYRAGGRMQIIHINNMLLIRAPLPYVCA